MRSVARVAVLALVLVGCAQSESGPETSSSVTIGADVTQPAPSEQPTTTIEVSDGNTCDLLAESDLAGLFPNGIPEGVAMEAQGGLGCTWGPVSGNVLAIVWPREEYYSDFGQPLDIGDEASMDVSTIQSSALVRIAGKTLGVYVTGLDIDVTGLEQLTRAAAGRL